MKIYTGIEEPLLLHAGVEERPEWSTPWVNYSPLFPQLQPHITQEKTHTNRNVGWFSIESTNFSP